LPPFDVRRDHFGLLRRIEGVSSVHQGRAHGDQQQVLKHDDAPHLHLKEYVCLQCTTFWLVNSATNIGKANVVSPLLRSTFSGDEMLSVQRRPSSNLAMPTLCVGVLHHAAYWKMWIPERPSSHQNKMKSRRAVQPQPPPTFFAP
jgi:hypothetical protein